QILHLLCPYSILICVVASFFITKQIENVYKRKNIESTKIEYYMDIADEVSDLNTQVNWKDIMAIEMAIYKGDLTKVRKKDSLNIGKKFIKKEKDDSGDYVYLVNDFESVLNKLNMDKKARKDAISYRSEIENIYLVNKDLAADSKQVKFISRIKTIAIENYNTYKVLPSITIAQCILESGWGESDLSTNSNNLFGIKADKRWDGKSIDVSTSENYDDKIVASFRVYNSIEDSIRDHGKFLSENKRYGEHGLFTAKHYTTQAQALEDAGYSTKKDDKGNAIYADMLINLIRNYNLQLIDWEVQLKEQ
ncbi:MAG: glycoside hydrolase family 73 protein, partial [Romboutsia sp.]|uniref:glycoside hydrolase family 73 protein n=1 Tax=Romboutsia sp. TaxID=1965302 RepID=UPI003F400F02